MHKDIQDVPSHKHLLQKTNLRITTMHEIIRNLISSFTNRTHTKQYDLLQIQCCVPSNLPTALSLAFLSSIFITVSK